LEDAQRRRRDADDSKLNDGVLAAGSETQLRPTEQDGLNCDE